MIYKLYDYLSSYEWVSPLITILITAVIIYIGATVGLHVVKLVEQVSL